MEGLAARATPGRGNHPGRFAQEQAPSDSRSAAAPLPLPEGWVKPVKRNGASLAADPTLTGVWVPEGTLYAWRFQYRFQTWSRRTEPVCGVSVARRSRRRRFRRGLGYDREDLSLATRRFRDRIV